MSFDRLAPCYRWMESVLAGDKLQRSRTAFLNQIPAPRAILMLGEGTGRFLTACHRRFPRAPITCVDASAAMLDRARAALRRAGGAADRVAFIHADVQAWAPPATYDLVVTHFFLDCFPAESLAAIVARVAAGVAPGANWLLADFQLPPAGWRRVRAVPILWLMYRFFRLATALPARALADPAPHLARHGFRLHRRQETEWRLLHSDWWRRD